MFSFVLIKYLEVELFGYKVKACFNLKETASFQIGCTISYSCQQQKRILIA